MITGSAKAEFFFGKPVVYTFNVELDIFLYSSGVVEAKKGLPVESVFGQIVHSLIIFKKTTNLRSI